MELDIITGWLEEQREQATDFINDLSTTREDDRAQIAACLHDLDVIAEIERRLTKED